MNLRDTIWFGQMIVSGTSKPFTTNGPILQIQAQFMRELQSINPRELSGGKSITIRIGDKPFDSIDKTVAEIDAEAWSHVEIDPRDPTGPLPSENYESYMHRLIHDLEMIPASAKFFADDWFAQSQDIQTQRMMRDTRAQRFIQLNSSKTEYENALPSEYETLKHYFIKEYPERAANITFRTA